MMNQEYEILVDPIRRRATSIPELAALDVPSLIRPSIRLTATPIDQDDIELGGSRIGGVPDVPPWWEWPRWGPAPFPSGGVLHLRRPAPLGFIAQIDLAAMPSVDDGLPSAGWLYFFYDRDDEPWGYGPEDRGCCRVIHVDGARSRLARAELPVDLVKNHMAGPCRVTAQLEPTLPDYLPDAAIPYKSPAYEAYWEFSGELNDGEPVQHRLLGHPQLIQNPMELDCQLASNGIDRRSHASERAKLLAEGARDWRLLLQIDSDEDGPGWEWGDGGRIYFWIRRQDLNARRFDDVWLIFQCS